MDSTILDLALANYKKDFVTTWWPNEKFKWEAVLWFQQHWDDEAEDFSKMLSMSFEKTESLLSSSNNFPMAMICDFASVAPNDVRTMFRQLFDESQDLFQRIFAFKNAATSLLQKYGKGAKQHYQNENTISTYLWLRYPDKYYIYKFSEVKDVAQKLESKYTFKKGAYEDNLRNFYSMYDEICEHLQQDTELTELLQQNITDMCHADAQLKTLTIDIGFYISRKFEKKEHPEESHSSDNLNHAESSLSTLSNDDDCSYWWLNANPKIWSFQDIAVGESQTYTLYNSNGNKRRIFQNFLDAKPGDMVIGYESNPVKQVVAICKITAAQDGEQLLFEKVKTLSSPLDLATIKECTALAKMEYFQNPQGSLFRLDKGEYNAIFDMISEENQISHATSKVSYGKADFLQEVYMEELRFDSLLAILKAKKNIILQGAPGVGKTFAAKRLAYAMMGEKDDSRIELVQFHQNYTYEDFVMGYKPDGEGFSLQYGVFYRFCQKASAQPQKDFFFCIDEINRGNLSKIFGELLMLIEKDYRGTKATLAYNGITFSVPENLHIIGMMNTADRSLAMIDYALRRRFSFFPMVPSFQNSVFKAYQASFDDKKLNKTIEKVCALNEVIAKDSVLGKGFAIGHSYFCSQKTSPEFWLKNVIEFDILPILEEYWFDNDKQREYWCSELLGIFQ